MRQHINALMARWLIEEADRRVHGTVKEVVAERFKREAPTLAPGSDPRFLDRPDSHLC
jgi:hypothetical protein